MAVVSRHRFYRPTDDGLILIQCLIGTDPLVLALDTGASHTTIDLSTILIAGYEIKDTIRTEQIETANGIIETKVFNLKSFSALGITKYNFEICVYDFIASHSLIEFDGVIGLDFFKDIHFCIDINNNEIILH